MLGDGGGVRCAGTVDGGAVNGGGVEVSGDAGSWECARQGCAGEGLSFVSGRTSEVTELSVPGTTGTPAAMATARAEVLSANLCRGAKGGGEHGGRHSLRPSACVCEWCAFRVQSVSTPRKQGRRVQGKRRGRAAGMARHGRGLP